MKERKMQTEMFVFIVHILEFMGRNREAVKAWQHRCTALAVTPFFIF